MFQNRDKEEILKTEKKRLITFNGVSTVKLIVYFTTEITEGRRLWNHNIMCCGIKETSARVGTGQ